MVIIHLLFYYIRGNYKDKQPHLEKKKAVEVFLKMTVLIDDTIDYSDIEAK